MKEIEKYVGYYVLVYIWVLIICGFFQYMSVCQGKSLECNFSVSGLNTILTTTAALITPIIAIIGFLSWRNQETFKKTRELLELILVKTRELHSNWHQSRVHGDISRFQLYCMKDDLGIDNFDNLDVSIKERKNFEKNLNILSDLRFLTDLLHLESGLDIKALDERVEKVSSILEQNLDDLYDFQQQLIHLKYGSTHYLKSENEMRVICDKLDDYCNNIMGHPIGFQKIDYGNDINTLIRNIANEIISLRKSI